MRASCGIIPNNSPASARDPNNTPLGAELKLLRCLWPGDEGVTEAAVGRDIKPIATQCCTPGAVASLSASTCPPPAAGLPPCW